MSNQETPIAVNPGTDSVLKSQLIPAAIIDSALTCLLLTIVWSTEFLAVNSLKFWHLQSPTAFFNVLSLATPVLAPLMYQLGWHACGFNTSPGKKWTSLDWLIGMHGSIQGLWLDLAIAFLSVVIASGLAVQTIISFGKIFRQNGFLHLAPLAHFTIGLMLLAYLCSYCMLTLWRYYLQYSNTKLIMAQMPVGQAPLVVSHYRDTPARSSFALRVLLLTLSGFIPLQIIANAYSPHFFKTYIGYAMLVFPLIALLQGAFILRYWHAKNALTFYIFFYAIPCYLSFFVFPIITLVF